MTNGTANETYAFDVVGNRTSSHLSASYNYQPFNRMSATASKTMSYDANGNMTSKNDVSGSWTYSWDYENRMTSTTNGTNSVSYAYDALGRRVKRTESANITKFTYDGLDVVLDDDNGVLTKYQNGLGIDNKLKLTSGGVSKYFLQDHLGSTVGLADSSGNLSSSASYDSFGNSTNNLTTRYQYTGREKDELTGLMYYRARWYDANLGRFISEDPIGFAGGDVNLFGYVQNNPNLWKDPSGLHIFGVTGGGSAWGGTVLGGGCTAGTLVGYSPSDGFGTSSSGGCFYGPGRTPADTSRNAGWAIGGGGGIGGGFFYSNATKWHDHDEGFATTILGLGPVGAIEYDSDYKEDGVRVVQLFPGPFGKGHSYGITHLGTYTPPSLTEDDVLGDIHKWLYDGVRNLYHY